MAIQDPPPISPELRELLLLRLRGESRREAAIVRQERAGEPPRFPLSFAQQRLWFIDRFISRRAAYNVPLVVDIAGPLAIPSLRAAVDRLVRRHEILRTTYSLADGEQLIHPAAAVPMACVDLAGEADAAERAAEGIRAALEEPFDLERGPVLAAILYRLAPARHVLLLNIHHIATDGQSTTILLRELEALCRAHAAGRPAELPEPAIQYADYAVWQRARLAGPVGEQLLAYWRSRLADPPRLELAFDRPRPQRQSYSGAMVELDLPASLGPALKEAARREQVTPFALLLSAFAVLLYRYSGQRDLVIGAPFANRQRQEVAEVVGCFVNTLPLRAALAGSEAAWELCRRVHGTVLEAQEHQELPFELIVDELAVARDPSHTPLYQVVLNFQTAGAAAPVPPSPSPLRLVYRDVTTESAKFDLTMAVWEADGVVAGNLVYDTRLFDPATAARLAAHFARLLLGIAESPHCRIGELAMLSPAEQAELASGRYGRGEPAPASGRGGSAALLTGLFEARVAAAPDTVAVAWEGERWTYGALNRRANRLAHRLMGRGVGPEVRVGLCCERSADLIAAILGILKAGGAYVPLDPAYPQERLRFIAEDAGLALILATEQHRERLPRSIEHDVDWLAAAGEETNPPAIAQPDNAAYVMYTSGSTGRPKGVVVSHRNVVRLFDRTLPVFHFGSADVWSLFHSYAFDFSVWEIWGALLYGGRLVVVPYWVSRSPADFRLLCAREQVTLFSQSPSAFRQLVQPEGEEGAAGDFPAAVRCIVFGAERLDWTILEPWFRRFGAAVRLVNMYGITETTVHVTHRLVDPDERPCGSPVGRAIDDLDLYLRDGDGSLVPLGVAGEVQVGGAGPRAGLSRPSRPHRRALRAQPLCAAPRRAALSLRRPGAAARRRRARLPGPHRRPGEGPRLPHRARRGAGGLRRPARSAERGRPAAPGSRGARLSRRLRHPRARRGHRCPAAAR